MRILSAETTFRSVPFRVIKSDVRSSECLIGTQTEHAVDSTPRSTVGAEFYSLLDAVDSEFIADDFGIGTHTGRHDFDNHLKVATFEGVHPSDLLADLAEKTDTHDELAYMAGTTFSRLTNDRDYRAVVRLFFELLHSPQLYTNAVFNANGLSGLIGSLWQLTLRISPSLRRLLFQAKADTEFLRTIQPGDKGLHLNVTARVDGHSVQIS